MMKKAIMTIAIVLGLSTASFADGGGLFQRGASTGNDANTGYSLTNNAKADGTVMPILPNHGESGNQPAPVGSGIAVLAGLGAAYLIGKKRREE